MTDERYGDRDDRVHRRRGRRRRSGPAGRGRSGLRSSASHQRQLTEVVVAHHGRVVKADRRRDHGHVRRRLGRRRGGRRDAAGAVAADGRRTCSIRIGIAAGDVSWEDGDCFGLPVVAAARLAGRRPRPARSSPATSCAGWPVTAPAPRYEPLGPFELQGPARAGRGLRGRRGSRSGDADRAGAGVGRRSPPSWPCRSTLPVRRSRARSGPRSTRLWRSVRRRRPARRAGRRRGRRRQDPPRHRVRPAPATTTAPSCSSAAATASWPCPTSRGSRPSTTSARAAREELIVERCARPRRPGGAAPAARAARCPAPRCLPRPIPRPTGSACSPRSTACSPRRPARRPVVLVLDDLHWAGRPTLALLRHLARWGDRRAACSSSARSATPATRSPSRWPAASPTSAASTASPGCGSADSTRRASSASWRRGHRPGARRRPAPAGRDHGRGAPAATPSSSASCGATS